jgi:hypothetical protein
MEKLSDEKLIDLKFVLDNSDVVITHHNSDHISMRDVVCDSLEIRKELAQLRADAETSQNHNAAVIDPLIAQLRDAGYTGTLSEMVGQACEVREATRWIPVGERLPKEPDEHHCTRCFVFYENPDGRKYSAEGSYIGDGRFDVTGRWKVTHWMPLPVPPEGGTK